MKYPRPAIITAYDSHSNFGSIERLHDSFIIIIVVFPEIPVPTYIGITIYFTKPTLYRTENVFIIL